MPEKDTTSVNLRVDYKRQMDELNMNRSALINELLGEYFSGGDHSQAAKELRLRQIEQELATTRAKAERLEEEKSGLEEEITPPDERKAQTWQEALADLRIEELKSVDTPMIESSDADVEYWAAELGLSEADFREELIRRYQERQDD